MPLGRIEMECYLDNAATTICLKEVLDNTRFIFEKDYANPSAMHIKGVDAEKHIKESRSIIANALNVKDKEIIFTSGGSESNNLAIIGSALANKRKGKHIITTSFEHPSVSAPIKFLQEQGFSVDYIPVDSKGKIDINSIKYLIKDDTILVSTMYVNNEIGSILPVEEIGQIIKQNNSNILYHVDAIQAFGKIPINIKKSNIDLLSASGHKIHATKGSGFLYIKEKTKISPIVFGGGQEYGIRSGTENVAGISSLGIACNKAYENLKEDYNRVECLKTNFLNKINTLENVLVNGDLEDSSAYIISISVLGVRSEVMLHSLEDKGIYVSAGSACSTHKANKSVTLNALGLTEDRKESAIRISLSRFTKEEELNACFEAIKELAPLLRRFHRM